MKMSGSKKFWISVVIWGIIWLTFFCVNNWPTDKAENINEFISIMVVVAIGVYEIFDFAFMLGNIFGPMYSYIIGPLSWLGSKVNMKKINEFLDNHL